MKYLIVMYRCNLVTAISFVMICNHDWSALQMSLSLFQNKKKKKRKETNLKKYIGNFSPKLERPTSDFINLMTCTWLKSIVQDVKI